MVRVSQKCPPGVFCVTPGILMVGGVFLLLVGLLVLNGAKLYSAQPNPSTYIPVPSPQEAPASPQPPIVVVSGGNADDRYTRAPKPERDWGTRPDMQAMQNSFYNGSLPQVATRGIPEQYQAMGVMKMEDGQVLPVYGRRTASRSDRFQYYTRTDTYNPVQLPISYKRRDCQDDVGCDELFDGERVKVGATGQEGTVSLYRFSGPTYIPAV